jgi:Domain of unknown function (DUF4145)
MSADSIETGLSLAKEALTIAKAVQDDAAIFWQPPAEVTPTRKEAIASSILFKNARRNYLTRVTHQINLCYEHACFDACAVMIRRLKETLIIEAFEAHKIEHKIKKATGEFLYFGDLINAALNEPSWHLGRKAKHSLKRIKDIGDTSAHSRRYNALRHDIEEVIPDIRAVAHEFLSLAGLR